MLGARVGSGLACEHLQKGADAGKVPGVVSDEKPGGGTTRAGREGAKDKWESKAKRSEAKQNKTK